MGFVEHKFGIGQHDHKETNVWIIHDVGVVHMAQGMIGTQLPYKMKGK